MTGGGNQELVELKAQRDMALATLILAVAICAASFASVFGPHPELAETTGAVAFHRNYLKDAQAVLDQNRAELEKVRAALK